MLQSLFAGAPYAHTAPNEIAVLLTALMAWSRADRLLIPKAKTPAWLPWAFLGGLAAASCSFALGHPDALGQSGLLDQF